MTLVIWVAIAIVVLMSLLLIYMEHEWGLVLAGATAVILIVSYLAAELIVRSALAALLPQGWNSPLDVMAIAAGVLLVLALVVVAYRVGRNSRSKER